MSCDIRINEHGQGIVEIADADGELQSYRVRLVPRGISLWAIRLTRVDTGNEYLTYVARDSRGERWECSCPAQTYRKRRQESCKHCSAASALRTWLTSFMQTTEETSDERATQAV